MPGTEAKPSNKRLAVISTLLAFITFLPFTRALTCNFVGFDDNTYVYNNSVVTKGLTIHGIGWALFHFQAGNWHPLTWISHMLDCQVYGLNPAGHHLTSVLLHMATVVLQFLVLTNLTGAPWKSAAVAALFAVHPLRVESVAWVAERKDVLSGLFFVLTIAAYARFARRPRDIARYALVVLLFALGLMCKPMLITLPAILFLLDYWPLQRTESMRQRLLEKCPLLLICAFSAVLTFAAQEPAREMGAVFPLFTRLFNALVSSVIYMWQTVWPIDLAMLYPFPRHGVPWWQIIIAVVTLGAISTAVWRQRYARPWLITGWLWYLVMLLPVIGIIQAGRQAHADRYTYLPQIGLIIGVVWLIGELKLNRFLIWTASGLAVASCMVGTWVQTGYWKNSEILYTHTLECTRDNDAVHYFLGSYYSDQGNISDAVDELQKAIKINPDFAEAWGNLGNANVAAGNFDEAITNFNNALRINPMLVEAHSNLGDAWMRKGAGEQATAEFQEALKIKPQDPWALNHFAWFLATFPDPNFRNGPKALEMAQTAASQGESENPRFLQVIAVAQAESGRYSDAVTTAEHAIDLAQARGMVRVVDQLQLELQLFQAGKPFHCPSNATPKETK